MDGEVWLGPNAVLALSREGYSHTDFNWQDFREILKFRYETTVVIHTLYSSC